MYRHTYLHVQVCVTTTRPSYTCMFITPTLKLLICFLWPYVLRAFASPTYKAVADLHFPLQEHLDVRSMLKQGCSPDDWGHAVWSPMRSLFTSTIGIDVYIYIYIYAYSYIYIYVYTYMHIRIYTHECRGSMSAHQSEGTASCVCPMLTRVMKRTWMHLFSANRLHSFFWKTIVYQGQTMLQASTTYRQRGQASTCVIQSAKCCMQNKYHICFYWILHGGHLLAWGVSLMLELWRYIARLLSIEVFLLRYAAWCKDMYAETAGTRMTSTRACKISGMRALSLGFTTLSMQSTASQHAPFFFLHNSSHLPGF